MNAQEKKAIKTIYFSIIGNALLAIVKGITGFLGNSFALIADAIESTTDVFSSLLVLLGLKYSMKPPDDNHPYGHGRAEPLVTFVIIGFLLISAAVIAFESIQNIRTPHKTPASYTLIVLGVVILVKEAFYRLITRKGKELKSTALKADAWHHRSDAITSMTAFLGISIALFLGEGFEAADDWAALVASGMIVYNAYLIFRPALGEIMDEHLHDDLIKKIRIISKNVPGVIDTEKCFARKAGMYFFVDLHIIVDANISVREGHDISHQVKDILKEKMPELTDVLIHIEPNGHLSNAAFKAQKHK